MYAIIEDGGKQYTVSPGQLIQVEKKDLETGKAVNFDRVVYYRHQQDIRFGAPTLSTVKVEGVVQKHERGPKVIAFMYRRRKDSRRKKGHRQDYTFIRISKITVS